MAYYGCTKRVICKRCGNILFEMYSDNSTNNVIGQMIIICPKCKAEALNTNVIEFECLSLKQQEKLIPILQGISKKEGKKFFEDGTYVICEENVVSSVLRTSSEEYCEKLKKLGYTITKCDHKHVYIQEKKCSLYELENGEK